MSTSPPPPGDLPALSQAGAGSADDVRELLGHLSQQWDQQRRQLARQLHDNLGSSMTALTMHLALLTQQLPREQALLDRSAQMKTLLMNIISTNRDMQRRLWNDSLEFLGLHAAISEVLAQFREQHGLVARLSLPDEDSSYPIEQSALLMAALEQGLQNVIAHASASEVDVIVDDDGDQVMLTVRDNGIGIGQHAFARAHHGLRALQARASYLGGSLRAQAAPDQLPGTWVTLILPRSSPPAGDAPH
ncbi:sensor histidine kinase [Massilia sp. PWRC2]|uniref:sensor histidine kinase n=1 Tax=Massilia sp. PWRC2 TaxID=2804626 RepID=UPI003CF84F10